MYIYIYTHDIFYNKTQSKKKIYIYILSYSEKILLFNGVTRTMTHQVVRKRRERKMHLNVIL